MTEPTPQAGKDLKSLLDTPRSPAGSYMLKAAAARQTRFHYVLSAFLPSVLWEWMGHYLGHRLGPRHRFNEYQGSTADIGIYTLGDDSVIGGSPDARGEIRVCLAGDWGTGTDESNEVAQKMMEFNPHYTIHLGDVYYVGDNAEVKENCLGMHNPRHSFIPCTWPMGSVGSFALNGNHEMYALGNAYFDLFLPALGMRPSPRKAPLGQKASFFCLQNESWRIIGLDTGYNSIGIPIFEYLFKPNCDLPNQLLRWLREIVKPSEGKRATILLSHHQYFSAFQGWYTKQAKQLEALIASPVLWFWGHEHRMAIYGRHKFKGGLEAYGRCIGHGGMPVEINAPVKYTECPSIVYDNRRYPSSEGIDVGFNGFVRLTFSKNRLLIDYRDLNNNQLLTESWEVNNGVLTGKDINLISQDAGLRHVQDLRQAIC